MDTLCNLYRLHSCIMDVSNVDWYGVLASSCDSKGGPKQTLKGWITPAFKEKLRQDKLSAWIALSLRVNKSNWIKKRGIQTSNQAAHVLLLYFTTSEYSKCVVLASKAWKIHVDNSCKWPSFPRNTHMYQLWIWVTDSVVGCIQYTSS